MSSSGRRGPVRADRVRSAVVAGLVVLGIVAVAVIVWGLPGPSGAGAAPRAQASEELPGPEGMDMRITDLEIPGPTAGGRGVHEPGQPNRIGSETVGVRAYEPAEGAWATLVWAHGGSFVHGTLDWPEADWVSRMFAEAGLRVYSVDYALATDAVKAPASSNDVGAVLEWALGEHADEPVVVGGASAGAYLSAQAALDRAEAAVGGPLAVGTPAAVILEYPTLHRVQRPDAQIAASTAVLPEARRFDAARISAMYDFYLGEGASDAVVVGELPGERLAVLPPVVIVNAEADDLRASAEQFAEQLSAAGVPVTQSVQAGTVHGYLNRPTESERARADAADTVGRFVAELRRITGR